MSRTTAIQLIQSLSRSEKRQFKLFTRKQSGKKDYLDLFDLIDQNNITDKDRLEEKFRKLHPRTSLDNTARYLVKILLDCLIISRVKGDELYQLLYGLLRVNILKERNLQEEGYRELNKLEGISSLSQNKLVQYIIYREKLNYLSDNNFQEHSEKNLVALQMKARDILKDLRNTHEHYSLYELLKYRLLHSGKVLKAEEKDQLNDLLLSEMSIINSRRKNSLESRKLHLLFQSYFFTDIGDYRSSLKTFYELNRLFERDITLWKNPPLDYFSALDGILDSLRTNSHFKDMDFYIQKMKVLDHQKYPEYFRFLTRKTVLIYKLAAHLGKASYHSAIHLINESAPTLWKGYQMIDPDKQNELLFYTGLAWFHFKKYKKAQTFIGEITSLRGKINYRSAIYKATRLLDILINYELREMEYLDYDIRSYKRAIQGRQKLLKTDKLVFKAIKLDPAFNGIRKNELLWKKLLPLFHAIEKDKYEQQLLKYFDFAGWVKNQFIRNKASQE